MSDQWFGEKTYSQHGEDLLLLNLFWFLGIEHPSYLDIGAHHPTRLSNTRLLYERGSRGVNVEANPYLVDAFRRDRPEDKNLAIGVGPVAGEFPFYMIDSESGRNTFNLAEAEAFVKDHPSFSITAVHRIPVVQIEELVQEHCGHRWPHLLNLDVEGYDLPILQSIRTWTPENRPHVICVEAPMGATAPLRNLMSTRRYMCVVRMGWNLVFAREEHILRITQ